MAAERGGAAFPSLGIAKQRADPLDHTRSPLPHAGSPASKLPARCSLRPDVRHSTRHQPQGSTSPADPANSCTGLPMPDTAVTYTRCTSPYAGRVLPTPATITVLRPATGGKSKHMLACLPTAVSDSRLLPSGSGSPAGFCNLLHRRSGQTPERWLGPKHLRVELPSIHAQTGLAAPSQFSVLGFLVVLRLQGEVVSCLVLVKLTNWKFPQLDLFLKF